MCSLLLSDLSYLPNLALTQMSAWMRGVKAHARSHASRRDSEKKRTAYIILNDIETFSISLKNLGQISFILLASNMRFVMHEFC